MASKKKGFLFFHSMFFGEHWAGYKSVCWGLHWKLDFFFQISGILQFRDVWIASVGVTPRSKQLGVTPRTPLFEGKNPENQKLKISIK